MPPQEVPPDTAGQRAALIESGDVTGLREFLLTHQHHLVAADVMDAIGRVVQQKARMDLSGLGEDVFASVITFGTTMLLRAQLHTARRLMESDALGGFGLADIPADLVKEDWFGRIERISTFLGDMIALRARVAHLSRLHKENHVQRPTGQPANGSSLGIHPRQNRNGKVHPANGRVGAAAAPAVRIDRLGSTLL